MGPAVPVDVAGGAVFARPGPLEGAGLVFAEGGTGLPEASVPPVLGVPEGSAVPVDVAGGAVFARPGP